MVVALGAGCAPLEYRIDETKGIPSVAGALDVNLGTGLQCGTPIMAGDVMVTTQVVPGGCGLSFGKQLELLSAQDYADIPDFRPPSVLVQRVELTVKKLAFTDGAGQPVDLATRILAAKLSVNGQTLADKDALTRLPLVVPLEGEALAPLKAGVDARQPVSVGAQGEVAIPNEPPPPDKLHIEYDVQPALIIGTGKIL